MREESGAATIRFLHDRAARTASPDRDVLHAILGRAVMRVISARGA
ncbi:hypothetical protein [Streptomyces albidoflavus]